MTKVIQFPICASQGHAFCAAVLRRAHILSLASSPTPAVQLNTPTAKTATVVPIKRGFVAAPSLTGGTAVATLNQVGGDDE